MWLSPFTTLPSLPGLRGQNGVEEPGRSKLMSQNGSIVVETPLEAKEDRNRIDNPTQLLRYHLMSVSQPSFTALPFYPNDSPGQKKVCSHPTHPGLSRP